MKFFRKSHGATVRLGTRAGTRRAVEVEASLLERHLLVAGDSGMGVRTFCAHIAAQHVARGGGLIWIDGKADLDVLDGLPHTLIDLGHARPGNAYDPWHCGSAEERAKRYTCLLSATEGNPGAEFYRRKTETAVREILSAAEASGFIASTQDLALALGNRAALAWLLERTPATGRAGDILEVAAPLGARLRALLKGCPALDLRAPALALENLIENHGALAIALPLFTAIQCQEVVASAVMSDLLRAVAAARPAAGSDRPPTLCVVSEMPQFAMGAVAQLLEQGRGYNVAVAVACEPGTLSGGLDPNVLARVSGNASSKAIFRLGSVQALAWAATQSGAAASQDDLWDLAVGECLFATAGAKPVRVWTNRPRARAPS